MDGRNRAWGQKGWNVTEGKEGRGGKDERAMERRDDGALRPRKGEVMWPPREAREKAMNRAADFGRSGRRLISRLKTGGKGHSPSQVCVSR